MENKVNLADIISIHTLTRRVTPLYSEGPLAE